MRKGIYIALALCAALCSPTMAHAEEINYLDSFSNGIETLKGNGENAEVHPESDYNEKYQPEEIDLYKPVVRALPEDATTVDQVNAMTDTFNAVTWSDSTRSLLDSIRVFLDRNNLLPITAGIVFMWWGVRKALRMIMSAFGKGKMNV